jgi:hypothetical protein
MAVFDEGSGAGKKAEASIAVLTGLEPGDQI